MAHDEPELWLASQSPRRRQLLDQIGVPHRVLPPDPAEDAEALEAVLPGEAPLDYVQRVTQRKLDAAVRRMAEQGGHTALSGQAGQSEQPGQAGAGRTERVPGAVRRHHGGAARQHLRQTRRRA